MIEQFLERALSNHLVQFAGLCLAIIAVTVGGPAILNHLWS